MPSILYIVLRLFNLLSLILSSESLSDIFGHHINIDYSALSRLILELLSTLM